MKQVIATQFPTIAAGPLYYNLAMGKHFAVSATIADADTCVPVAGLIRNLRVRRNLATGSASWTITLMVNDAATTLTATITDTLQTADDSTHEVSIAAGDRVCWRVSSAIATWIQLSWEWEALDGTNLALHGFGGQQGVLSTATAYQGALAGGTASGWLPTTSQQDIVAVAGTARALAVAVSAAPGAGASRTFSLVVNNTPFSGAVVTLSGTSTYGVIPVGTAIAAGDQLAIQHKASGSPTAARANGTFALESSAGGWNVNLYESGDGESSVLTQFWQVYGYSPSGGASSLAQSSNHGTESEWELIGGITPVAYSAMQVNLATAPGGGGGRTFTLRKNQSTTAQEVRVGGASTTATSTEAGVSVTAGDRIALRMVPDNNPAGSSGPIRVVFSAQSSNVPFLMTGSSAGMIQGVKRVYLSPVNSTGGFTSTAVTVMAMDGRLLTVRDSGGSPIMTYGSTPDTTAPTWTAGTFLSTATQVDLVHDRELVGAFDGASTRPLKSYDGTYWTFMGLAPSTKAPTLNSTSGGSLSSADFEVSYTFKHRSNGFESNGGDSLASTLKLGSSGAIRVVVPENVGYPSWGNAGRDDADAIVLYARNKTAGETVRRRATSAALPAYTAANTFSTLTITSSNWTSNDAEPTDHNPPPSLSFGCVWKSRWWAASTATTNRILFGQLYLPQAWPALFYLDLPFERGDTLRALVPMGDVLVVFGYTQAFVIIGQTPIEFEVRPALGVVEGAWGFRAVAKTEEGILHAGFSGVYLFDGQSDRCLTEDLLPAWQDLVQQTTSTDLAKTAMVYDRLHREVRVAVARKYPTGDRGEFVLDMTRSRAQQTPAWSDTDRPWGGYYVWDGPETSVGGHGRIFAWMSSTPIIVEEALTTAGNSSNLTAVYHGPSFILGQSVARWVDVAGEYEPHIGTFDVEAQVDGTDQGAMSIDISRGLSLIGSAIIGKSPIAGSGRRRFYAALPLGAEGRVLRMTGTYAGTERFIWYTYTPGLVPETQPREFNE